MATYGYDDALNKVEVKDKATTDSELAGKVPISRTINGRPLTGNVVLDATDIGALEKVKAGTGITIGEDGATVGHSNSIDARTVGSETTIPVITFDEQGHITDTSIKYVYPPTTKGSEGQYWRSDGDGTGTWMTPSTTPVSENNVLISSEGVYNALQKYAKASDLESVETAVGHAQDKADSAYTLAYGKQDPITVDSALDGASTNPIQNKVVNTAIYNLGVQLRNEIAGKQDAITGGTEGQVWTAGSDGTGSWQDAKSSSMKFISVPGEYFMVTLDGYDSTLSSYYVASAPTFSTVNFVNKENVVIAYSSLIVSGSSSSSSSTWYIHYPSDSEMNAIVTGIFGTSDFTDFPDCTITIGLQYGKTETAWRSDVRTLTISISNGVATTTSTGIIANSTRCYVAVKSITIS